MRLRTDSRGFTLVELLVVIGIIALLISILLPTLGAARRQAQQTKCMAALKEIGNAFQMYAIESRGYYPPAQLKPVSGKVYNVDGVDYPNEGYGAYWYNFLTKYVQKAKVGTAGTGEEIGTTRNRSVFWGCGAFEGYNDDKTNAGMLNRVQPGYGMNGSPTYTNIYPRATVTPAGPFGGGGGVSDTPLKAQELAFNTDWDPADTKKTYGFVKQRVFQAQGATRCLVGDSALWLAQSGFLSSANIGPQWMDQNVNIVAGDTNLSLWRHGKLPRPASAGTTPRYNARQGKLSFNILYADGHVANNNDPVEAFKSIRMKFPG